MPATVERLPDRASWLARRRDFVGGSEVAMLCGLTGGEQAPVLIWARKLGLLEEEPATPQMERGTILEPYVAQMVATATGLEMRDHGANTIAWHPTVPRLAVTLDREVSHPVWGAAPCEIKTSAFGRREWSAVHGLDVEADPLLVPARHYCQVQAQLACTGGSWALLAVLLGLDDLRLYRVAPNREWIAAIEQAVTEFWPYVERREEPPARGPDDLPIVRLLHEYRGSGAWVDGPGELLSVTEEWCVADAHRRDLMVEVKHWQGVQASAEAVVRQAMGDAKGVVLPNGSTWERSATGRLRLREQV